MALQPWAIDGATLSAAQGRSVAFKATSGARGITLPGDLRVIALPTPGSAVRVLPGGATIPNDYPGGAGQSYGTLMVASEDVNVPATGSGGGATRYLIQRIIDPEFSGQPPADPLTFRYDPFELVSSVTGLSYPFISLARIDQPASTATITQAMITDLRQVANPRTEDVWRPRPLASPDVETLVATRALGEWFPNAGGLQSIEIPSWATRMQIRAEWLQVRYDPGNAYGQFWLEWGPGVGGANGTQDRQYLSQPFQWDSPAVNNTFRTNWIAVDDLYIPAAMRGTTQSFVMKARRSAVTPGFAVLDGISGVSLQVRFLQVADPSTT